MFKMPCPGENHSNTVFVAGFYGKLVVNGAPGLDNGLDSRRRRGFNHIGEGEEGIRGENPRGSGIFPGAALYGGGASFQRLHRRPNPVYLTAAYACCRLFLNDDDGV